MNNDERNEIIRAFRKFYRLGLTSGNLNPIQVYRRIEMLCHSRSSRLDMLAVFDTLRLLELSGDEECLSAIREVYLSVDGRRLNRAELGSLALRCAQRHNCDERTIYRRLEKARALYSLLRSREGLLWDGVSEFSKAILSAKLDKPIKY